MISAARLSGWFAVLLAIAASANEQPMSIGVIAIDMTVDSVTAKLGEPNRIVRNIDWFDETREYRELRVHAHAGYVIGIESATSGICTGHAACVGENFSPGRGAFAEYRHARGNVYNRPGNDLCTFWLEVESNLVVRVGVLCTPD